MAIIDWHYIDDTSLHRETTATFWSDIAPRFANDSHVLFELYNEPINGGSWPEVKTDMQAWYDLVRAAAPNNLVLVGTPNWSQIVGPTGTDPIDGDNVVYVAHMYPQHWGQPSLRTQISTAAAWHPLFLTEWGFQQGSNDILDGTITSYGAPFKQFVEEQKVSWTAWCASSSWGPPMFDDAYLLRVGEGEMGGFAKDWLYEKRDADQPSK
jgi:endoglucanase